MKKTNDKRKKIKEWTANFKEILRFRSLGVIGPQNTARDERVCTEVLRIDLHCCLVLRS